MLYGDKVKLMKILDKISEFKIIYLHSFPLMLQI